MSSDDKNRKLDKMDLVYAAILGLAVVITAWCGYQHELWSSALTFELKQANTAHREFTTAQLKEGQSTVIDAIAFTGYLDAVSNHDQKLSDYYKNSFRPEMRAAFDAWMKTDPFNNTTAKTSPFDMPEYPLSSDSEKVNSFLQIVDEKSQNASKMSSIASNYVFFTSMYASVSFLEGIGRVFASRKMQFIFLVMGAIVFSATTIVMFGTMPIYPGNFSL
ncbi:hypothetical protein HY212_01000 [Candidatus Pacearchaeota archaeon]|nr:hypothetical protein [Candidatus Pacearchaeota archaeon]